MAALRPRYSKEEFARRGDVIFEREIKAHLKGDHPDKFVAIDIETGAYEVDADEMVACDRLRARVLPLKRGSDASARPTRTASGAAALTAAEKRAKNDRTCSWGSVSSV